MSNREAIVPRKKSWAVFHVISRAQGPVQDVFADRWLDQPLDARWQSYEVSCFRYPSTERGPKLCPVPSVDCYLCGCWEWKPLNNANAQGEAVNTLYAVPSQAAWFLPFIALAILVLAYGMAMKKGPIPVWVSLMAVLSYSWWVIKVDAYHDLWLTYT